MNDYQLTENFHLTEFQCHGKDCCGGSVKVNKKLVTMLQHMRTCLNQPLVITSGYRCKSHNHDVGGVPDSPHMQGIAADIVCPEGYTVEEFAEYCLLHGFTGVGAYHEKNFVHVDVRSGKQVRFQ